MYLVVGQKAAPRGTNYEKVDSSTRYHAKGKVPCCNEFKNADLPPQEGLNLFRRWILKSNDRDLWVYGVRLPHI
jgi:hypothetical protein